ncbi:putative exported peptidase M4 [metagenome]|uniref:Putative exported peptidase M4 n=1 Tax=metagenome TaxID=256318 RepID=A0A2P2CGX0_9ZZZZ
MKVLNRGLALAVVGAGLAASPLLGAQATAAEKAEPSLLAQMRDQSDASVTVTDQAATGTVGFVRTKGDLMPGVAAADARAAASKADAYLAKYAPLFGARAGELNQSKISTTPFGWTVTFDQSYKGVPVWAGQLKAHVAEDGDLTAVTGFAAPDLSLDVEPGKSSAAAAERAVVAVKADPPASDHGKADVSGLKAVSTDLVVYRQGVVKGERGDAVLAYDVEVSNVTKRGGTVRDRIILDAGSLKPLNRYSMMAHALDRSLYTTDYDETNPAKDEPDEVVISPVWSEGDDPSVMDQEQQNLMDSSAESYWMHMNTWGVDSYDDAGGERITLHNRPDSCPNASWNGQYTSYCAGVYDDDTVAHEWGHAYTEYETGLIYQWQSGALNESYSDIWGETVDLLNGREDEGEGDLSVIRTDQKCSTHSPALPVLTINAPSQIAKDCLTGGASFGEPLSGTGITGDVMAPTDAVEEGGTALDGCSPYDQDVTGKIVLVDRGLCAFEEKAEMATAEGAAALIIGNRDEAPIGMSGANQDLVSTVSIGLTDRESIRTALNSGQVVNVTMRDVGGDRVDSFRWLLSEKSSAFGGAIRDMWNPTCHGDPGKVSDAEYKCSSDDNGGVHGNSGVPNHGYALLVDGGSFNGQTVEGLGFDKAANIYFYAQNYMGPTSDFVDHADSLEQACADLTGVEIKELSFAEGAAPANAEPITAADCEQVTKMIAAVELRLDPTIQCDWKPLLDKGPAPALCGDGFTSRVVFSDNFDAGVGAWTKDQEIVYENGIADPWRSAAVYPGKDNVGRVAFAPAGDKGDCVGDEGGDYSSSDSITSPSLLVPTGKALRLSFDHYVSTEAGYDGGNVKLSINGGDFEPIAPAAYVFNAPNTTLTSAATNTNPLAGEPGFSGTNPGRATGSWGNSQVNLEAAGAKPGDSIQIRFDMGRDGCGGVEGWYVDNVSVTVCDDTNTTVTATHVPEPSVFGTASKVDVVVAAAKGGTPGGTVDVLKADGNKVGSATLAGGKASVALPADLPVGTHVLTVNYAGSGGFKPSSGTVTVTVKAAPGEPGKVESKTVAKIKPAKPEFRENFKVVVKIKASETAKGKVVIRIDGKLMGKAKVKNGKAVFKIKRDYKIGKHVIQAKYKGSDAVERSKERIRFRVVR